MRPRHAVLLTPSVSLRPVPLPHYLPKSFPCHRSENSPVSPAVATLPKTPVSNPCVCHTSETPLGEVSYEPTGSPSSSLRPIPLSPYPTFLLSHFFSHSCALFCTHQNLNPFVFKRFRTLCQKSPGVGEGCFFFRTRRKGSLFLPCKEVHPCDSSRAGASLGVSLLNTPLSRRLELVAGNPPRQRGQPCGLRSKHKRESGDHRVPGKIHVRAVLVTRLMITVLGEILGLLLAPFRRMARVLDPFIDRKRGHAHARQAEMVRTVVMPGLRAGIGTNCQMKVPRRCLHHGIKRRSFRAADFHLFRRPQ